ncbi:hypothetical protein EDC01DRAFT_613851 [Geopyxis carbonaria]|nr:hypothetical protein EDC01DRAFT_613851 [Geopyxis carbonaria]
MATSPRTPSTTYRGLPPTLRTPSFSGAAPLTARHYSPGGSLHSNEDPLVLEIGAKHLRAGFANEPTPRCVLTWNERLFRRVGEQIPVADGRRRRERELWQLDLWKVDLGLVEDLLERGLRQAYNKYLLIDSKTKKIILPVPPLFPTRLLSSIVKTIFTHFQPGVITIMSSPVLATVAAGLRSALVVDIGWHETIVTPVYELRAIEAPCIGVNGRSRRGIKTLRTAWMTLLTEALDAAGLPTTLDPNDVEELMERLGWCRPLHSLPEDDPSSPPTPVSISPTQTLSLPFTTFAQPTESTFFAPTTVPSASPTHADDDDTPLPALLHYVLAHSTVDVRSACLPRIIIVGGGSHIPGLQKRLVDELRLLVNKRGWDPSPGARPLKKRAANTDPTVLPPPQEFDWRREITESPVKQLEAGEVEKKKAGEVKGVKSLGAWAGGSLVGGLRVKGRVELERERFLGDVARGLTGLPLGGV